MSEEAVDTLSEDLAAAWEAAEGSDETEQLQEDQGHAPPEPDTADVSAEDPDGGIPEGDNAGQPETLQGAVQGDGAGTAESDAAADEKPPVGLSPEVREAWKDLPDVVKKEMSKREKDYEAGIVKYADQAKRAEAMDRSLAPYQQLFAMNGGVGNTLPGLLQTASVLQMGSAPQKAEAVASIIKQFGVDIRTLDNLLVGNAPPKEVQQQSEIDQLLNQRLAPLQQQLQQYQQREQMEQQARQQQIGSELEQFAAQNEFYADVRSDMADLMEMATNRGREMSLQEAYDTACRAHPQISKIIAGRTSAQETQRKRNAASSISGNQGGELSSAPGSIAAALEEAWDNAGRM